MTIANAPLPADRTTSRVPRYAALSLLSIAGVILIAASPLLLILGGWGGSDSGSVLGGLAIVVGLPWLIYLLSAVLVFLLLRRLPYLACLPAIIPLAIEARLLGGFVRGTLHL